MDGNLMAMGFAGIGALSAGASFVAWRLEVAHKRREKAASVAANIAAQQRVRAVAERVPTLAEVKRFEHERWNDQLAKVRARSSERATVPGYAKGRDRKRSRYVPPVLPVEVARDDGEQVRGIVAAFAIENALSQPAASPFPWDNDDAVTTTTDDDEGAKFGGAGASGIWNEVSTVTPTTGGGNDE